MSARGMLAATLLFSSWVSACGGGRAKAFAPTSETSLAPVSEARLDESPKSARRAVNAEVVLRAYLTWFGGLGPTEAFLRARGDDLFDQWTDYLAALGLPDHHVDAPRSSDSNSVMRAALGRIGEALCIRSAEHDLRGPMAERVVFAFAPVRNPSLAQFGAGFDVLHRTFLSYPATLAPAGRVERFFRLYQGVARRHGSSTRLDADTAAWVAVCTAMIQHPESGLY